MLSDSREWVNSHITKGNHAHGLPDTQADTGGDATVETLETVVLVDVLGSVADSHLLGSVGILLLALHLDTDDLNGLIPGRETTTEGTGSDLFESRELVAVLLAGDAPDPTLSKTAETETGTPVGHLSDSDSIDTLVDTANTIGAVDGCKSLEGGLRLDTSSKLLVLGDLSSLHAGAETHGGICLSDTTGNTTNDTTTELRGSGDTGVVLGLGGDEQEDGTLGGSFNPGPGDETLVDYGMRSAISSERASARARNLEGIFNLQPRTPPRAQTRPKAAGIPSPRLAAIVVLTTSRGCPRVVTSNMFRPAPSNKLENLMGFFSRCFSTRGPETGSMVAMTLGLLMQKGP